MQEAPKRLSSLEEKLGYTFKNIDYLIEALTHPSNNLTYSNQRLEFLGDSVASLVISERIYKDNPYMDEGKLSSLRSALTSGEYMIYLANKLELSKYLILNNPADAERIRKEESSVADAFESVMGAIFLDSNFDEIKRVILGIYKIEDINAEQLLLEINPKGTLQELAAQHHEPLNYYLVEQKGKDHAKMFKCQVAFRNKEISGEFCSSKRKAEASAAFNMLKEITSK
ncbi:MAG: ribonuclease III [Opitutales bacterium]